MSAHSSQVLAVCVVLLAHLLIVAQCTGPPPSPNGGGGSRSPLAKTRTIDMGEQLDRIELERRNSNLVRLCTLKSEPPAASLREESVLIKHALWRQLCEEWKAHGTGVKQFFDATREGASEQEQRDWRMRIFMQLLGHSTPSRIGDYEFFLHAPGAFEVLRRLYSDGATALEQLIRSVADFPLLAFANPAQSGAHFYQSGDKRFLLKSVQAHGEYNEMRFFQSADVDRRTSVFTGAMADMYEYLRRRKADGRQSLLPRFYALFSLKPLNGPALSQRYFIVLANVFPPSASEHVDYQFDLKGAVLRRKVLWGGQDTPEGGQTCRDLDFIQHSREGNRGVTSGLFLNGIGLAEGLHARVTDMLAHDAGFLAQHNIMDYSLLLGVHFDGPNTTDALLEGGMAAMCSNCRTPSSGGHYLDGQHLVVWMGIIDILQEFGGNKVLESVAKYFEASYRWLFKRDYGQWSVFPATPGQKSYPKNSVVYPRLYAARFVDVLTNVMLKDGNVPMEAGLLERVKKRWEQLKDADWGQLSRQLGTTAMDGLRRVKTESEAYFRKWSGTVTQKGRVRSIGTKTKKLE